MYTNIPLDFLKDILDNDAWIQKNLIGVAPGTDDLGEAFEGIFRYKRALYRVDFTWGNYYYMSQVGEWDSPFPGAFRQEADDGMSVEYVVKCQRVNSRKVTTIVYEPYRETK